MSWPKQLLVVQKGRAQEKLHTPRLSQRMLRLACRMPTPLRRLVQKLPQMAVGQLRAS